jgi:CRP-like cAMP-binding protein
VSKFLADVAEYRHIVAKLMTIERVPAAELDALGALPTQIRDLQRGENLVAEGERPAHSAFLLNGFAASYKGTADGGRQILALYISGDMPDLQSLHLMRMDQTIAAMAPSTFALVAHADLRRLIPRNPTLAEALWRDTLITAAIQREWMMGLGRKDARGRIARLFCELLVRSHAAGLTQDHTFALPLTQMELADVLGLTNVHVNRVLQDLRQEGLVEFERGVVRLTQPERLEAIAQFDSAYLHLSREPAG